MCPTQPATFRPMATHRILTGCTRQEELQPVPLFLHHGTAATIVWQQSYPTAAAPEPLDGQEDGHKVYQSLICDKTLPRQKLLFCFNFFLL